MEISQYIDHTLLKPDATQFQITKLIEEAKKYNFMSVMVNPYWVEYATEQLRDSDIKVATVIGFPLGANTTDIKVMETKKAIEDGAQEVDMVQNIGELKAGHIEKVRTDIEAVVKLAHAEDVLVKVIIETALLTTAEITIASKIVAEAGADFVKTSTGFASRGASVSDVKLMYDAVGERIGIKASGGIHSLEDAEAMINAGATRLGTSSGLAIVGTK
ncbi:deoxyribose-phosphate aldolase [Latilactobacillus curvatus]|uniref:deoxyribose-phosphate aldolase n=1 Tax=Latilactobacillus curvatus TaxID=28038 RepID=UPI000FECD0C6|nr:deoxyribose-phosphate aldolase [Latilactobacillus curvatus]QAR34793.1 deoxyribose-phosphate aldolase [Latilactobacillus curvatus]WIE01026.1 deoxyribose-phosphate aldolase [Latilactobacillus curvatus]